MTEPTRRFWQPTDTDLLDLQAFDTELLLRFDADGRLGWANDAALAVLGVAAPAGPSVTLAGLDPAPGGPGAGAGAPGVGAPGSGAPDRVSPLAGRSPAEAAGLPAPGHAGPAVGPVRTADGREVWWEWSARRAPTGEVHLMAHDVTPARRAARVQVARQRMLDALVEGAAAGIAVRAVDGRLVLANDRFRRWFPDAPEAPGPLAPADVAVVSAGTATTVDEVVETAEGRRVLLTVRFPLRDQRGRVAHVATVASDITARMEAEAASAARQRQLDTLLRVSPDVVTLVDRDRHLVQVSDEAYAMLSLPDTAAPIDLSRHVHHLDKPELDRWLDGVLSGRPAGRLRHRFVRDDGRILHMETTGRPVTDATGAVSGAVLVSRDVSAAVDVQARLEHAVAVAEDASRAKGAFLSRITHELRIPVEEVLATADRLRDRSAPTPLTPSQQEAVGHIDRAGRHLRALIDEVLDVARVERRGVPLVLEPVAVAPLVHEAAALARPLGDARGVRVTAGTDAGGGPWVWADRQRLLQVLLNLLSNGVKYNRAQGTVRVSVSADHDRVRVTVADTGVGIAPEHLHRLFDPFDRLGAEHSGVEGTGVGLTLTKHLVEQMGGTVAVTSVVGTGTVFTVELGVAPAPARRAEDAGPDPGHPVRVLHVEDDPASGALVRQLLDRRGGVDLEQAADGATALGMARRRRPDLVLLDLGLPDVSGETVLAQLRADPVTADVPVVVVSADATEERAERLRDAGAVAYLTKPVAVGQLLALVDAAGGAP